MQISAKNLGFGALVLLGIILAFAPVDTANHNMPSNQALLDEMRQQDYFISAEELAHLIIDKDPGFQLIDLRSKEDYEKYHIPSNMHIPFETLDAQNAKDNLDEEKMIILASNGNTRASQAWILLRQMGYEEIYILAGGMNNWVNVFNNPQQPENAFANDELFKYQFRTSAGSVMMGKTIAVTGESGSEPVKPKPVKRTRKKAKKKVDEGC